MHSKRHLEPSSYQCSQHTALFICASFFLCQEAPTLGQTLQNTVVFCRREGRSALMDLEKIGPQ